MTGHRRHRLPTCREPAPLAAKYCEACGAELARSPGPVAARRRRVRPPVGLRGLWRGGGDRRRLLRQLRAQAASAPRPPGDGGPGWWWPSPTAASRHHDNEDAVAIGQLPGDGCRAWWCATGCRRPPDRPSASQAAADAALRPAGGAARHRPPRRQPVRAARVDEALEAAAAAGPGAGGHRAAARGDRDADRRAVRRRRTFVAVVARLDDGQARDRRGLDGRQPGLLVWPAARPVTPHRRPRARRQPAPAGWGPTARARRPSSPTW